METKLIESDLNQFTGTENYYRHPLTDCVYTDGVKYVAEEAGAYWLLDAIFSYRRKEPFQIWKLTVSPEVGPGDIRRTPAVLEMREDSDRPVLVRQEIEYTDFPLFEITMWLIDGVLILPSEY